MLMGSKCLLSASFLNSLYICTLAYIEAKKAAIVKAELAALKGTSQDKSGQVRTRQEKRSTLVMKLGLAF